MPVGGNVQCEERTTHMVRHAPHCNGLRGLPRVSDTPIRDGDFEAEGSEATRGFKESSSSFGCTRTCVGFTHE